jgi:UV DNA damage endonuclease
MLRFGLCCVFRQENVQFRTTTATHTAKMGRELQLVHLSNICLQNAKSLLYAVQVLPKLKIGSFRVASPIFPLYTHPDLAYTLDELSSADEIKSIFQQVRSYIKVNNLRLGFHPDQFVTISSPTEQVVQRSIQELEYQGLVAELVGADFINVHAGGAFNDKPAALKRFCTSFEKLSDRVKHLLTLENDDKSFTIADLYPICKELRIPLVYDIHHHRCKADGFTIQQATEKSIDTWQTLSREPIFHISSPHDGWTATNYRSHSDYIDVNDFPQLWKMLDVNVIVEVEAKAKELAVAKLMKDLQM